MLMLALVSLGFMGECSFCIKNMSRIMCSVYIKVKFGKQS